ncbi:MAG TPA: POTRA domain-containing protein [Caulobacteraceae bacterium]
MVSLLAAGPPAAGDAPLSNVDPTAVLRPSPTESAPIEIPQLTAKPPTEDLTPRFTLNSVAFDDAHAVSEAALEPAWASYRNRAVSLADLSVIAMRAEAIYAKHGFPFVAVVVNPQQVRGGDVRFKVIEGRIADLTVLGTDPVGRRQATAAFEPLVGRMPLSAGDVEGAYEHAKAIPGLAVAGALRRGDVRGGIDLVVQAKREEWRTYANVNNLYPDALGPWGALVGVDHFGGSAYGDQTSAQFYHSLAGGPQTVVRLSHAQGLDPEGTTLSVMALGAWAEPGRAVAPLQLATNVFDARVALSQPILERLAYSLSAAAAFEIDNQKTEVFSRIGLTDDKLRIVSLSAAGERRFADGARVAFTAEIRQGLGILGASHRGDPLLSRLGANPDATVGRFSLEGQSPAYHKVTVALRTEAQVASAPLTTPEQYAVGNLSIGRGYQPGANFGDDVVAASGEVRLGPYRVLQKLLLSPFAFYDSVHLWTHTPGAAMNRTLSSTGVGVRIDTPNQAHIDLTYAAPLDPPLGLGEHTPHGVLLVNVTFGLNGVLSAINHRLPGGGFK